MPGLLLEGRLHRSLEVIAFADGQCPSSRSESDAQRVAASAAMDPRGQSGRMLFEQGQARAASGDEAEAQRLYDRAIAALEAETGEWVEVDLPFLEHRTAISFDVTSKYGEVAMSRGFFVYVVNATTGVERMRLRPVDGLLGSRSEDDASEDHSSAHQSFQAVEFSRDGNRIFALYESNLHVWDRETGALDRFVPLNADSTCDGIALSKDERTVWASCPPYHIRHYDMDNEVLDEILTRALVVRASTGGRWLPTQVANPNNLHLGSTDAAHRPAPPLALIDVDSARVVARIPAPSWIGSAAISPDGSHIAIASSFDSAEIEYGTMFEMRRLPHGSLVWRKRGDSRGSPLYPLEFSADGRVLHLQGYGLLDAVNGDFLHREFSINDSLFDRFLLSDFSEGKAWSWETKQPARLNGARLPDQNGQPGKLIPQFMLDNLYDYESGRDVTTPSGAKVAVEWFVGDGQHRELWGVTTAGGNIELNGTPKRTPVCRVGHWTFPYALCRERVHTPNLRSRAIAGDPTLEDVTRRTL